jgi:DNA-binding transcriptional regulator YiaG
MLYVIHVWYARSKRQEQSLMRPVSRKRASKNAIALALVAWRKRNKLSQSKAALKLKLSVRTLQEWEQGRSMPRHLALEALRGKIGR